MKPERIQFAALLRSLVWGIFQILHFETPAKAKHFRNFIRDMADNHGRQTACKLDKTHTRVTLLVAANTEDDIDSARTFANKVLDIYADWSSPEVDTPADTGTDTPSDSVS